MADVTPPPEVVARLAAYFHRNGYVRRVDAVRRAQEGQLYKKGAEVRLVAESRAELLEIRRLLKQAGFKPGRSFAKARQWRQPVYGVTEVARFLSLIGEPQQPELGVAPTPRRARSSQRTRSPQRGGR
jgi:hypothetical protein